jgi:hypothetical protein
MISLALLALVVVAALIATKWLAFAGLVVIWSARRAVRLARQNPGWYGGYKTAVATLSVTVAASAVLATYGIAHIPQALENYRLRQIAATQASMYHAASLLEAYVRTNGSYPETPQEFKKVIGESLPADYWDRSVRYQGYPGANAARAIKVQFIVYELRSAGPDGIVGTDDDIVMRDGIPFTNAEVKNQPLAQQQR